MGGGKWGEGNGEINEGRKGERRVKRNRENFVILKGVKGAGGSLFGIYTGMI